jgi:pseudaminic acid synthase
MNTTIKINQRLVGTGLSTLIIAELSANHHQNIDEAARLIKAAKEAGADAVKLQTYTPETITIKCDNPAFNICSGTPWDGKTLYELYDEAYMPWDWQPKLKELADDIGIDLFAAPFDKTAVDFLQDMDIPAYKVASFEIVDIPLIEYIASKGKPIIISTGMSTEAEIEEALKSAQRVGAIEIALLKCTSAYPAYPETMNLRAIPHLAAKFDVPVGLSDHTLGIVAPVVAVSLGACIIEKHLTLSRDTKGPDSAFSLEPKEFKTMVAAVRTAEKTLGEDQCEISAQEAKNRVFRRSLFAVKDIEANELFTEENVRSIRPGHGMHPRNLNEVLGRKATSSIKKGTPLSQDMISKTP